MKRVLTGIKSTGQPHLGNYLGAMRPAIQMTKKLDQQESYLFIPDYHSLISVHDGNELRQSNYMVAATWIACGLDPDKTVVYRQSDVPEIFELNWILSCFTPKGFMNRAHAYKARLQDNEEQGRSDLDTGVSMGLYNYPVLMAADILLFSADEVPVGEDQVQHIEFARDIAQKFNHAYGDILKLPKPVISLAKTIPGLDGRKMSKSYNNHIPVFAPEKKLRKLVMKIKTDSSAPEDPKDPSQSTIFDLFKEFSSKDEQLDLAKRYETGIGWGEAKQALFEKMNEELAPKREVYEVTMADIDALEKVLAAGAEKARVVARKLLGEVRSAIGV